MRTAVRVAATALPAAVAFAGSDVFYSLIAFAGGFPIAVLYGVLPPLFLLRLRDRGVGATTLLPGGDRLLAGLALLSAAFLLVNANAAALPAALLRRLRRV